MIHIRSTILIPVAALALGIGTCIAGPSQRSVGQFVDDATLTVRVKAALIEDPTTKARQINVETYRGKVQLNGFVSSSEAKAEAQTVAKSVGGIREVHNNLEVRTQPFTAGQAFDNATLTTRVKAALIAAPEVKALQIDVESYDGIVQLAGWVGSTEIKAAAGRAAQSVKGVKTLHNNLEVRG
jgi:hyperosmotically inducible periplasmic protein